MIAIHRNIKRPEYHTINALGRSVLKSLFDSKHTSNNIQYRIKYNKQDIVQLLNYIGSRLSNDVSELKFNWGDSIISQASAKQAVHNIGVRGGAIKHHNKQAIISSQVVLDENNNCLNKRWIKDMCPHKSDKGTAAYSNKCINIRKEFDAGSTDILCEVKDKQRRNSYEYTLSVSIYNTIYHITKYPS